MFRTIGDGPSAWELLLPAEVLRLPPELARVDALLDDPVFFAPFAPHFHPVLGRPGTPAEWYLRLMFLKFRYRLGFESLCAEVSDSISWRRFCRIPLDGRVPHPTTLMKLTTRCGAGAVAGLNEALWAKAAGRKLLRTTRVRADTTVIGANVAYPADSGLLAKAVGKLVRAARRLQAAGGAPRTVMTDRRRAAGRRVREIASKLRARGKLSREETTQAICRVTGELDDPAVLAGKQATLDREHATPRCIRQPVAADLAQAQWPAALVAAGFNPAALAAFVAEALTYYLPERAVALLLDQAAGIAAPGSRLGVDMVSADYLTNPAVTPSLQLAASRGARWQFGTKDPGGFLAAHRWQADIHDMFAVARSLGRWPPPGVPDDVADRAAAVGRNWFISATRVP